MRYCTGLIRNRESLIQIATSFFNLTLTWSHRKGASSPAARGELLLCPWWIASSSGLTGDSICLSPFRRSSVWMNSRTLATDSLVPHMLPLIPSGARIIPPETRWTGSARWGTVNLDAEGQKNEWKMNDESLWKLESFCSNQSHGTLLHNIKLVLLLCHYFKRMAPSSDHSTL